MVMIGFLLILIFLGVYSRRFIEDSSDFLVAGRELSMGINMFGVVASGFAGTILALSPGLGIRFGFLGTFVFAFAFTFIGYFTYGLLFSKTIRRSGAYTLPEWLEMRYDNNTRSIVAVLALVALIAVTANNVLALANVISGFFGWSLYVSIAIGILTFMVFTYLSGMWGVSLTDFVQALIGIVGLPVIIIASINTFGPFSDAISNWAGGKFSYWTQGVSGTSLTPLGITYPSILTMSLLFGIFLVWGGQHYWIRMASARTEKQARNAYVYASFITFTITVVVGLLAIFGGANNFADYTLNGGKMVPEMTYGFIIKKFPMVVGSFLLIFAMAASLSTAATTLIAAISVAIKDVYQRFINKNANQKQLIMASRTATIIIGALAWLLAYYPGGTTFLFAFATAWSAPAGILLLLGIYWKRVTKQGAFWGAVIGTVCMSIWAFLDFFKIPVGGMPIASYFHMSIVGVVTIIIPTVVISLLTQPKYYGDPSWTPGSSIISEKPNAEETQILLNIRKGYESLADLIDISKSTCSKINPMIEKLDKAGYIDRGALTGSKFWTFDLTKKAEEFLPAMSTEDQRLKQYGMYSMDYHILKSTEGQPKKRAIDIVRAIKKEDIDLTEMTLSIVKLCKLGYLKESGFFKRIVVITSAGEEVLKKLKIA